MSPKTKRKKKKKQRAEGKNSKLGFEADLCGVFFSTG
jgi:hypothetical protein